MAGRREREAMEEEWHQIEERYRGLFRFIGEEYPGFFPQVEDFAGRCRDSFYTTEGARVREWPEMRDKGAQTWIDVPWIMSRGGAIPPVSGEGGMPAQGGHGRAVAPTGGACGLPMGTGRGRGRLTAAERMALIGAAAATRTQTEPSTATRTQTEPCTAIQTTGAREAATQTDPVTIVGPVAEEWLRDKETAGPTVKPRGCWNCGSTAHRFSNCPGPRGKLFCYGCGRPDITLRECPTCQDDWKRAYDRVGPSERKRSKK